MKFSGLPKSFEACIGDSVVDPLVSSRLIENLCRTGSQMAFFRQVIQGVVQSAEGECPSRQFGDLIPDPDAVGLILEPPYGNQNNLLVD